MMRFPQASAAIFVAMVTLTSLSVTVESACPWDDPDLKLWSDPASWPSGVTPQVNSSVVITAGNKILLDAPIPRMTSLVIEAGGILVWDNVDGITMETNKIHIHGEMHVGSEDCRFEKEGTILIFGLPGEYEAHPEFGRKYIAVDAGGLLEMHGQDKLSWTKLTSTTGPATKDCGLVYDGRDRDFSSERGEGIHLTVWKEDGTFFDHTLFLTEHASAAARNMEQFLTYVKELPRGLVVGLAVYEDLGRVSDTSLPWDSVYTGLELLGSKRAREIGEFEPYALVAITGDGGNNTQETLLSDAPEGTSETKEVEAKVAVASTRLTFVARSIVTKGSSPNEARFRVVHSDWESPKINLMHDVTGWKPGDQLVVASTDFEWRQAEVKTILPCPDCSPYQLKLEGEFRYMHFGEVTYGVDERAEVGILTRNFKIEGTLRDTCYPDNPKEKMLCDYYGRDTFGAHIKVVRYGAARLEGLYLYHMGQQANLGCYAIHYHMADDITGQYVKQISVYDSMSRCVTIHAADGLEVAEMVCYLHLGHGIFLENSAEQNNYIHHNLVLGTVAGTLTPSDMPRSWCPYEGKDACNMLASYWITHPNNIVTDNVAAGCDTQGFAYSFSDVPMGPAYDRYVERGILKPNSTRYMRVPKFDNNVMHSNLKSGLWFDDRLSVGEMVEGEYVGESGRAGISEYSARDPPTENGTRIMTTFSGLTFYKNGRFDSWVRCGNIIVTNSSFGDSREAYISPHTDDGSRCEILHSLFIGETDNKGEPFDFRRVDGFYSQLPRDERPTHHFNRSASFEDPEFSYSGISFYQGPVYAENCYFDRFYNDFFNDSFTDGKGNRNVRPGSAISFSRTNHYPSAPTSGARNMKYGFCDGELDGHYVFHGNLSTPKWEIVDGAINANFRDYDGTVTGTPNTQVVHTRPFFTGPECLARPDWSMSVCPYNYFWLVVRGDDGVLKAPLNYNYPVFMNRDDAPSDMINMEGKLGSKFILRTNMSYTVRWNNSLGDVPMMVRLRAFYGLQENDVIRLAICFPKTTTQFEVKSLNPKIDSRKVMPNFVNSLAELDADTTLNAFYWDKDSGYFYLKLKSDKTLERVDQMCPGDECRDVTIRRFDGGLGPAYCDDVATPFVTDQTFGPVPPPPPCRGHDSPEGLGAPIQQAPAEAGQTTKVCAQMPVVDTSGRGLQESRGCYDDPGVEAVYIRLYSSMTPQLCRDRCFMRGYAYAGLTSGTICECEQLYNTGEALSMSLCNTPCSGAPSEMCGGSGKTEVFTTGLVRPPPAPRCGPGNRGVVFQDQCLYLDTAKEQFAMAQKICLLLGGTLTKIDSPGKQSAIVNYLTGITEHVWAGSLNDNGLGWHHLDGSDLTSGYTNWRPGRDQVDSTRFLRLNAADNFRWDNYGYWDKNMALCDLPLSWVPDHRLRICGLDNLGMRVSGDAPCLVSQGTQLTRLQAEYKCHVVGGQLVQANTLQEKVAVGNFLFVHGTKTGYWVAGDGSADDKGIGFDNKYFPARKEYGLTSKMMALCLLDEAHEIQDCPTGWIPGLENNCYLIKGATTRNFEDLSSFCNSERSHVLRIDSAEENEFVRNLIPDTKVWLDLRYYPSVDAFLRQDGQPSQFGAWSRGKPEQNLGNGVCANLDTSTGEWRNKQCYSGTISVVCEMDMSASPTVSQA